MNIDFHRIEARVVVGLIVAAMVAFILVVACFHEIPVQNKDLVNSLATFIVGSFTGSVIGFYFSDSKKGKTDPPTSGTAVSTTGPVTIDQTKTNETIIPDPANPIV